MTISKEEEIQEHAVSTKNHGYSLCKHLALQDNMEFWLLYWNISLNSQLHGVCPTWWMSEYCSSNTMPGHTQVCTQLWSSKNLDGQCCCTQQTVIACTIRFLPVWPFERQSAKATSCGRWGTVARCTSGCKEMTATFSGREYTFLFKGRRRLLTNMNTI